MRRSQGCLLASAVACVGLIVGGCARPEQELWNFQLGQVCSAVEAGVRGDPNAFLRSERVLVMAGLPDIGGTPAECEANLASAGARPAPVMDETYRHYLLYRQHHPMSPPGGEAGSTMPDREAFAACKIWIYDERKRFTWPWSPSGFVLYAFVMEGDRAVTAMKIAR